MADKLDKSNSCLYIVDMQHGFQNISTYDVFDRISTLLEEFKDCPIVSSKFINREGSEFSELLVWNDMRSGFRTEVVSEVEEKSEKVFLKYHYTSLTEEFLAYIKENGITTVFIAGVDTDACVLETAVDLFSMGIKPVVIENYCASSGGHALHEAALMILRRSVGSNNVITI